MWNFLVNFFGGNTIKVVSDALSDAYQAKLQAQTNEQKLEAEMTIRQLEARTAVLIAEQKRWLTAWVRPMLALPVVIVVWKLLVWDYVLNWGVSPQPGELIQYIIVTIIGAYMLTRPFERK